MVILGGGGAVSYERRESITDLKQTVELEVSNPYRAVSYERGTPSPHLQWAVSFERGTPVPHIKWAISYRRGTPAPHLKQAVELEGSNPYRGTSLMRNSADLGLCIRAMPSALWWSWGGRLFFMSEVPMFHTVDCEMFIQNGVSFNHTPLSHFPIQTRCRDP